MKSKKRQIIRNVANQVAGDLLPNDHQALMELLESRTLMSAATPEGALSDEVVHEDVASHAPKHAAPPKASSIVLAAPQNVTANTLSPTSISLTWTAGDNLETGFIVLRSTGTAAYTALAKLTSASTLTYTDTTALSFHTYNYEIEEYAGTSVSPVSTSASATTGLKTPVTPTATATGPGAIQLTWTSNEPSAKGYAILRSTDGVNFSALASVGAVLKYVDTTVSSGTQYWYELEATNEANTSAASAAGTTTTPLFAPSALTSTFSNGAVNLSWTDNDTKATGYNVLRSINGTTYSQIGTLSSGSATTYADLNVLTGHTYYYKIQATPGDANTATSSALTVNTPLVAPSGLTAAQTGPNTIVLNWTDNDSNAQGYIVYRGTDGIHFTAIAKLTGSALATYADKTAVSGTTYSYEVAGYANAIVSPMTASASATTPLTAPATVTATATGPNSVKLTWSLSDPLATGYTILQAPAGGSYTTLTTITGKTVLTYTDTTVSSGSAYSYEVQATNTNNQSAVSKPANVTTPLIMPSAVTGAMNSGSATINWTDNDNNAVGYYVLRAVDGKAFTQLANLSGGSIATYTDSTVQTGHSYAYEVQAYETNSITSAITAPVTVVNPLAAPSSVTATDKNATSTTLSWTDNDPDASSYGVFRSSDGVHFTSIAKLTGAAVATYTDAVAVSGQNYTYMIQAVNGTVTSPMSSGATVTTPLATPTTLTATATDGGHVSLAWVNKDPLTTGYTVLRSTDNVNFTTLTTLTGIKSTTYVDTTVSSDTAYYYEVQATNTSNQSAITAAVTVTTPLMAPTGLTATMQSGAVTLNWTDNDSNTAGFNVLRSSNGKTYTNIATINSASTTSIVDSTALTGHAYSYEVQGFTGSVTSPASTAATLSVPLNAPSNLAANVTGANIALTWTDNDSNATSYIVLRSTNGTTFTTLATVTGATTATYTDAKAAANTSYTYEVEAAAGTITSAASASTNITTPMVAPTSLAAVNAGAYVSLTWTDKDNTATGYTLLRSTDGVTFTTLTTLTSGSAASYIDTTVASGTTYYYQVQATSNSNQSPVSNTAKVTTPSGNVTSGVAVTTRYGDELVVTATGTSDSVSITENGSTVTIVGDGQTFTEAAPAAGIFVYTRGGNDSVNIDQSVTTLTTIDSIYNNTNPTVINTAGSNVIIWDDTYDTVMGTASIHTVSSFAGGVTMATGASLANPKDAGTTAKQTLSLFGTGPVAADINQGEVGDCYFLSSLAAFANNSPTTLLNSAVDLGDGTYAVEFHNANGSPVYVRVNNSFTVGGFGGYDYAHPGANNTIWAAVMEKAFCYFRTGANTYNSINSGWMGEVYTDLGVANTSFTPSAFSDGDLYNMLLADLNANEPVTIGTQSAPNLVSDHAYTLIGVSKVNGQNVYTVRNPWGSSGDSLENSSGIANLTYAQFIANFVGGTAAT